MSESQVASTEHEEEADDQELDWNEQSRELRDQAVHLATNLRKTVQRVEKTIERTATERPYAALGIAAGVGFVLGGGLSPRIFAGLMALGTRFALDAVVTRALDASEEGRLRGNGGSRRHDDDEE